MKIEDIPEKGNKTNGGKKELGSAEKWLFDTENGEIRLKSLMEMKVGQQGTVELSEFSGYESKATTTGGLANSLNKVFILGKLPLKACGRKDRLVIVKLEKFKLDSYGKADKIAMGINHSNLLLDKLAETLA
jgi:hypothetical protein